MKILTVTQWGNGQVVRLDKTMLAQAGIHNGSKLQAEVAPDGTITLKPLHSIIRATDLDALFDDYDGEYRGTELQTGAPTGEELI